MFDVRIPSPPMPPIRRIIFWQNVLSIHQAAFVRALAEVPDLEVWFAYEQDLPEARMAMGWTVPDYGRACVVDVRNAEARAGLLAMSDAATCHAFGGYFVLPVAHAAFKQLRSAACKRVWISEAFDFRGWRGRARAARVRWHALTDGRQAFHRIFAMGGLGVGFFRSCGLPAARIREFGYLVEAPMEHAGSSAPGASNVCRFLYVGQLIPRKGVDLLLRALSNVRSSRAWTLEVIGDGDCAKDLMQLTNDLGLGQWVTFHGNAANPAVMRFMEAAACLVLPSRWDGWGAVVNEALMRGTPVIASDACGAASLLVAPLFGAVFRSGDEAALSRALERQLAQGANDRQPIRAWASQALGTATLARYFLDELNATAMTPPATPPWHPKF